MLATLTDRRFSDPRWLFERKLDGERCLAFRDGGRVRLLSRTRQHLDGTYPEVVDALARQPVGDFVVDGEVVAFDRGRTSFGRLQQRLGISDPERGSPEPGRRLLLRLRPAPPRRPRHDGPADCAPASRCCAARSRSGPATLRYTAHRNAEGEALFATACARGWEGVIAKRADAPYVGRRSGDWLKFKCSAGQELVVGGFTEPAGSRVGLGALAGGLLPGRRPRLRRQGRHGLLAGHAPRAAAPAGRPGDAGPAVPRRRRPARRPGPRWGRGPLGAPRTGRRGRVHRVDHRRQAAPPPVRRAAGRQARPRRGPGGTAVASFLPRGSATPTAPVHRRRWSRS